MTTHIITNPDLKNQPLSKVGNIDTGSFAGRHTVTAFLAKYVSINGEIDVQNYYNGI